VSLQRCPFPWRVENAVTSYAVYLRQLVYPLELAVPYPHPASGLPFWKFGEALLLLLGITIAVVMLRQRHPYLLVGWLWYLGMLVPVIGLVQVGVQAMAD